MYRNFSASTESLILLQPICTLFAQYNDEKLSRRYTKRPVSPILIIKNHKKQTEAEMETNLSRSLRLRRVFVE